MIVLARMSVGIIRLVERVFFFYVVLFYLVFDGKVGRAGGRRVARSERLGVGWRDV